MAKWQDQMDRKMFLMREGWEKLAAFMSAQLKWNSRMDVRVTALEEFVRSLETQLDARDDALRDIKATSLFEEFFGSDRPMSKEKQ